MVGNVSLKKKTPLASTVFERYLYVLTGRIDALEIQQSLAELGIDISQENALKILQRFELQARVWAINLLYVCNSIITIETISYRAWGCFVCAHVCV